MWRIGKLPLTCVCVCIQNCSVTKSRLTFWDPTGRSSLGFPFLHHLPEFSQMLKYVCVFYIYIADSHCCTSAAAAKSLQSCPTLRNPIDGSPPGSAVPGILQARTLEWVAISFSSAWKWKVKVKSLSHVWLLATPWTASYQAPPSMGFSRQENWSGMPLPAPCCTPETNKTL